MSNHFPIHSPPPGLIDEWIEKSKGDHPICVAIQAAQWGADQELAAYCKVICNSATNFSATAHLEAQRRSDELRAARRPKPPNLKEQALEALQFVDEKLDLPLHNHCNAIHTIRRALEALPND